METGKDGTRALTLGEDMRFVLVAVGGGAIQVARGVARRDIRYLETVAVNCDRRVLEEKLFGKQVHLKVPGSEDETDGEFGVSDGMLRAHASRDAIARLFAGANFVTIVASLGGGSGSGILPVMLDIATRSKDLAHLTLFLIKPFALEERHRMVAERTMANLYFVEGLTQLKQDGKAHVVVLDNEEAARSHPQAPLSRIISGYTEMVASNVENSINAGKVAVTLDWLKEGEIIGDPTGTLRNQVPSTSFIPSEPFHIEDAATARLNAATARATAPSEARPSIPSPEGDIILTIEAEPRDGDGKPKGPMTPPHIGSGSGELL